MELEHLLARWRVQRDPALADAIDLLSGATRIEPFTGSIEERIAAWTRALGEPTQRARVLALFPIGNIEAGSEQLEQLAKFDDPRVVTRLLGALDDPPFRSPAALPFWTRALAIVEASRDPRAIAWTSSQAKRVEAEFAPPMGRLVRRELEASTKRLTKQLDARDSSAENLALLAELRERQHGDKLLEELLAAVYAEPDDDAHRFVYADRLSAESDPRGEFILLQLTHERGGGTRASKQREKQLLTTYAMSWLGELAPVINKTGLKYRRGFPDSLVFKANNKAQVDKLIGNPAWATVRSLAADSHWPYQDAVDALILHPVMRSLEALRGFTSPELLTALASSSAPRRLRALEFNQLNLSPSVSWSSSGGYTQLPPEGPRVPAPQRSALTEAPGLPKLRELHLDYLLRVDAKFMRWLFFGPLGLQLEHFVGGVGAAVLPSYMRELAEHPLAVFQTRGEERSSTYTLTRSASGRLDQLEVVFKATNRSSWDATPMPGPFELFMSFLDGLESDALCSLTLKWPKKKAPTDAQREALARALEARPGLSASVPKA